MLQRFFPILPALSILLAWGCAPVLLPILAPPPVPAASVGGQLPPSTRPPIIAALDYSPKSTLSKDDLITFTVVATDPAGLPLQFNWTATKGRLTTNSGAAIAWAPVRADGTLETGTCTVTVTVSNGTQTTSGSLNLQVGPGGAVTGAGSS
jgi:hypothetical protein